MGNATDQVRSKTFEKSLNALLFHYFMSNIPTIFVLHFTVTGYKLILLYSRSYCCERICNNGGDQFGNSPTDKTLLPKHLVRNKIIIEKPGSFVDIHLNGSCQRE